MRLAIFRNDGSSCIFTASKMVLSSQAITIAGERRDSNQLNAAQSDQLNTIITTQLDNVYAKLVRISPLRTSLTKNKVLARFK